MELWIVFACAAALFQTVRFMLQKVLSLGSISALGSTFARFAYAVPFAAAAGAGYLGATGAAWPALGPAFWAYALIGGLGQILATALVVALFAHRNFAVGITLKKTEVIQTALLGLVVLGEGLSAGGWAAIGLGLVGVLLLSRTPGDPATLWQGLRSRAVGLGLASGFFFAVSGVGYRGATLEIAGDDPVFRAIVALICVNSAQALALLIWLGWRAPEQVRAVWAARRTGVWLGLTSMGGSVSWFTAFSLQTAAYVFAVGQVELIFSLLASVLFFRETVTRRELLGMAVLTASIVGVVAMG